MNLYDKALNSLVGAIKKYVDIKIKKAQFDITMDGIIIDTLDGNNYKVNMQGAVYTALSCTSEPLSIGNIVLILTAQNNNKQKYIIGRIG